MADFDRPRFNLRLTPELERQIAQSSRKCGRSKNAEIIAALEWRYQPDAALQLAEAMRPMLEALSPEQIEALTDIVTTLGQKGKKRRR